MIKYNVMWVDDQDMSSKINIIETRYELKITQKFNWIEAYIELYYNFDIYDAIILDANCKYDSQSDANEDFLGEIALDLGIILNKKLIPWYIYSAGTMNNFSGETGKISKSRKKYEDTWGRAVYYKEEPGDIKILCNKIREVASKQDVNIIKYQYQDVLQYIGDGNLIDSNNINKIRSKLISALCALYFPNKYKHIYNATNLRKILEAIFRVSNEKGILPDECINCYDFLANSCHYMSGELTNCGVVYGNNGDSIFPKYICEKVNEIRKDTNKDSHYIYEINKDILVFNEEQKYMYFSYVLQLCDVIKWFGEFMSDEKNIEEAKGKIVRIPKIGDVCTVIDDNGTICDGNMCLINLGKVKSHNCIGKTIIIKELKFNTLSNKYIYPYYISDFDLK